MKIEKGCIYICQKQKNKKDGASSFDWFNKRSLLFTIYLIKDNPLNRQLLPLYSIHE